MTENSKLSDKINERKKNDTILSSLGSASIVFGNIGCPQVLFDYYLNKNIYREKNSIRAFSETGSIYHCQKKSWLRKIKKI